MRGGIIADTDDTNSQRAFRHIHSVPPNGGRRQRAQLVSWYLSLADQQRRSGREGSGHFPARITQKLVPGKLHWPQKVIPPVNAIRLRCFREIVYNTIIGSVPTNAALSMGPMRNR